MRCECSWSGAKWSFKKKAFLLAESCLALLTVVLATQVLFYCIAQTKTAQDQVERRVDRAYASYVLKNSDLKTIRAHDHVYRLAGGKIFDVSEGKSYAVR